jgi:hypothetical protein
VLAPNAKLRALVVPQGPDEGAKQAKPPQCETNCAHHRPVRLSWTRLLKRVFNLDLAHCANGGGELKIIAAILEQPVIEKILTHLGLQGPGAATGPRAWTGPAGRLSAVNHRRLSDLTPRVVGIACVQGFAGRSDAALLPGQACERALR